MRLIIKYKKLRMEELKEDNIQERLLALQQENDDIRTDRDALFGK
jgi:hypothetical protein